MPCPYFRGTASFTLSTAPDNLMLPCPYFRGTACLSWSTTP
ncbi:hypothetical protein [Microseira wollei]|nr:hypothetical protein [Microseira wollei]